MSNIFPNFLSEHSKNSNLTEETAGFGQLQSPHPVSTTKKPPKAPDNYKKRKAPSREDDDDAAARKQLAVDAAAQKKAADEAAARKQDEDKAAARKRDEDEEERLKDIDREYRKEGHVYMEGFLRDFRRKKPTFGVSAVDLEEDKIDAYKKWIFDAVALHDYSPKFEQQYEPRTVVHSKL